MLAANVAELTAYNSVYPQMFTLFTALRSARSHTFVRLTPAHWFGTTNCALLIRPHSIKGVYFILKGGFL
ncbi:MAG TPA: hypothetical protein PLX23_11680 [Candidatus Hydrogenedens sp.]|nr:hypothetical protein [Candidatus Hydrogenedens sp.]